jgi:GSCFA family
VTANPYRSQPDRAFWSRAIAGGFSPEDLQGDLPPAIRADDLVVSAGSCFASNLVPWLERAGVEYVRTEEPHPAFAHLPENLGYRSFSAAYGNIYSAKHLRQLLERAVGDFVPHEDRWHVGGRVIDPFRPGLRYPARSDAEFDLLTSQHLAAVRAAFQAATVFVFTLGLTEAWVSTVDGAAYPACPGVIAGAFDPDRHRFHNDTVSEVREDLEAFTSRLRQLNPGVRVVLTVSPVPLVATATDAHVLVATTYSKAVLRAAAGEVAAAVAMVTYFPAYEIVTGPQAPENYFKANRRDVSEEAVAAVMSSLLGDLAHPPASGAPTAANQETQYRPGELSRRVAEAECDEVLADV